MLPLCPPPSQTLDLTGNEITAAGASELIRVMRVGSGVLSCLRVLILSTNRLNLAVAKVGPP